MQPKVHPAMAEASSHPPSSPKSTTRRTSPLRTSEQKDQYEAGWRWLTDSILRTRRGGVEFSLELFRRQDLLIRSRVQLAMIFNAAANVIVTDERRLVPFELPICEV